MRFLSPAALFGLGLLALQPALAEDAAPAYDANTVMAVVNGTEITLGHMIVLRSKLPDQYQNLPDETLFPGILDQLVDQQLLGDKEKQDSNGIPFAVQLAVENEQRALLATSEIRKITDVEISEDEIQAAWQEAYGSQPAEEEWHAAHILVATEDEAKGLITELDGGADFAELAKAHSSDPSSESGGDLGWFGLGMMVKPFEDAVVATAVGSYSQPVQSQFGWHIVKVLEKREKPKPTVDEVRSDLITGIQQKKLEAALEALRTAAKVERPETGVPLSAIRQSELVMTPNP